MRNSSANGRHITDRLKGLFLLFLLTATLVVYAPVGKYDFLSYDDQAYVAGNNHVRAGLTREGVIWAFRDNSVGHWHPLTWLSHMADVDIYGLNPGGHHLTNLIFHLINTWLLFFVLRQMTGMFWRSAFVAALFALHPLNVESVAWVAERKSVLSTFFWFAAIGAYACYAKRPGFWSYAAVFVSFALGLLAKPMLVTLPFVLLLLDYWPLKRWHEAVPRNGKPGVGSPIPWSNRPNVFFLLWEKIPFFILTSVSIWFTLWAARVGGALVDDVDSPLVPRLYNAVFSYGAYLFKMTWPVDLAVIYPYTDLMPLAKVLISAVFLAGISGFVIYRMERFPYLFTGWFWYMGTLVPVIGLVQVGAQAMADRYAYVSLVGIFVVISWGISDLLGKVRKGAVILIALAMLVITALTAATRWQVQLWQNTKTLFNHAIAVTDGNYIAHDTLGVALLGEGKREEAIAHFLKAVEIKPNYAMAYNNLGIALQLEGRASEALSYYWKAVTIKSDYGDAFYNLGTLFESLGNLDKALAAYRQAVVLKPASAPVNNNFGVALAKKGDTEAAIAAFRRALRLDPNYAGAHYNLSIVFRKKGLSHEADVHRREAERLNFLAGGR